MPQPAAVEALTVELLRLYDQSWQKISDDEQRLLDDWTGLRRAERLTRLRELQAAVESLMDQADAQALRFVQQTIPQAYLLGAAAAGVTLTAWAHADVDAISVLAADSYAGLLDATRFVRESTKQLIRTLSKQHLADKLIRGLTAEQAGRNLAAALEHERIAAVVYKDGSRHGLSDYADMVARTKTAEAYSVSTLNQIHAAGIGWVEVFDGIDCVGAQTRLVPYGDLQQVVRGHFTGPLYTITAGTLANPRSVTVGPNHPMLTRRGWVRAHLLKEDDELVYDLRFDVPEAVPELDLEDVPVVTDLFEALVPRFGAVRALPGGDDLHGDAAFCDGEVEVVTPAGGLLVVADPGGAEQVGEPVLVGADGGSALVAPLSHRPAFGLAVTATSGLMCLRGPSSPFLGPCPPVPPGQRLAAREAEPLMLHDPVDGRDGKVEATGYLAGGQPLVDVEATHLVDGMTPRSRVRAGVGAEPAAGVVVGMKGSLADLARGGALVDAAVELSHEVTYLPVLSIVPQDTVTVVYDATTTAGVFNADGFVVKNCGWESHSDPDKANGTVRTVEEAMRVPLSHPRCARAFGGRPDVHSAREAAEAKPTTTPAQQADQQEAEIRRALDVSRRASDRALEAQVTRRADALLSDAGNRVRSPAYARTLARREARLRRARRRAG